MPIDNSSDAAVKKKHVSEMVGLYCIGIGMNISNHSQLIVLAYSEIKGEGYTQPSEEGAKWGCGGELYCTFTLLNS